MNRGADVTLEKTLPNSIESERAVLGAIILDHKAIFPATEILTAEDFHLEGHREIFRAMLALAEEETSIDSPGRSFLTGWKVQSDPGIVVAVYRKLIRITVKTGQYEKQVNVDPENVIPEAESRDHGVPG